MKAKTKPYHLHWNLYVLPVGRSIELYTGTRHNVIRPNKRHKFMHNSDKNKQIWIFIWLSELDFIRKTIEPPVTKQTTNLTVAQWKSTAISWYETHDFLSTASLFQCPLIFFESFGWNIHGNYSTIFPRLIQFVFDRFTDNIHKYCSNGNEEVYFNFYCSGPVICTLSKLCTPWTASITSIWVLMIVICNNYSKQITQYAQIFDLHESFNRCLPIQIIAIYRLYTEEQSFLILFPSS